MRVELVWDVGVEVYDTICAPEADLVYSRLDVARGARGWALSVTTWTTRTGDTDRPGGSKRNAKSQHVIATLPDEMVDPYSEPYTVADICDELYAKGADVGGKHALLRRVDVDGWTLWEAPSEDGDEDA